MEDCCKNGGLSMQQPGVLNAPQQVGMGGDLAASEVSILRKSIEEFNKQASKQTQEMIHLTYVIAALTAIMTIFVGVQIYLALTH